MLRCTWVENIALKGFVLMACAPGQGGQMFFSWERAQIS